ncbi:MAG: hypothetical protein HS113_19875 [Verrucomicrobiales bacterium]|nr:hypothetical protein [Verrucomicrobiales bacterium]
MSKGEVEVQSPPRHCPFGLRLSNFGLRHSPFELRLSNFGLRLSNFGLRHSNFGLQHSPFGLRLSSFGLHFALLPATLCASTNLTFKADLAVKETYDSNVYLQDEEPDLTKVPQAVQPFQDSFVTSVTPRAGLDYRASSGFNAALSYAPEFVWYHAEPSEDHIAHRSLLNLGGKLATLPWQFGNSLTYVQGSEDNLYFGAPGGPPAIGSIPIRDRRQQLVYRGKASLTWDLDSWFFRPSRPVTGMTSRPSSVPTLATRTTSTDAS